MKNYYKLIPIFLFFSVISADSAFGYSLCLRVPSIFEDQKKGSGSDVFLERIADKINSSILRIQFLLYQARGSDYFDAGKVKQIMKEIQSINYGRKSRLVGRSKSLSRYKALFDSINDLRLSVAQIKYHFDLEHAGMKGITSQIFEKIEIDIKNIRSEIISLREPLSDQVSVEKTPASGSL